MASDATRQHYSLATGKSLQSPDTSTKVLKYARGGKVGSSYYNLSGPSGKLVGKPDRDTRGPPRGTASVKNDYKGRPPGDRPGMARGGAFKANPSGRPGDDKYTSVTQKKVAPGFRVHKP